MPINLNDSIKINAGKPIDSKYLNSSNLPYVSVGSVNSTISISERYLGLTVNVNNVDFWYKDGVNDNQLVEKIYNTLIPYNSYVTGGTNVGYFSSNSGILTLPINFVWNSADYNGDYNSLYNYYYRGADGIIHIGVPKDGILKRGFLKSSGLVKSWIWNEYIGGNDLVGWILIDGDVSKLVGTFQNGAFPSYYDNTPTYPPYTDTQFDGGVPYTTNPYLTINVVQGSLTTGNTITVGARPFAFKDHNELHFRTLISDTPETLSIYDDEALIHISGKTNTYTGENIAGSGFGIYSGMTNNTFMYKKILPSGNTQIYDNGNELIVYTCGGVNNTTYNLSSPSAIGVGGICAGAVLTGKTAFQLFEDLLVPRLCPTLISPYTSVSLSVIDAPTTSPFEIGRVLNSASINTTFNAGCISPQYSAACGNRSNGVKGYSYVSPSFTGYCPSPSTTNSLNISGHIITSGSQIWNVSSCYCQGVQPYDNKCNAYCAPLPEGSTASVGVTVSGILPWYWGISDSQSVNAGCVVSCGKSGLGGKCIGNVLSSPIQITFNSTSNDYIWFALPSCAATKTCWYVDATNKGSIGTLSDLFGANYVCSLSSAEGCWVGQNYEIYVSNFKTGTTPNIPMCIY